MEVIDTLANILFVVIIANFACLFLAKNENRKSFIWNREIVIAIMIVAISPLIYRMLQTDEVVQTEILVLRSIVCLLLFILSFILVAGECLIERRKNKFSGGEYRALLLMGIMLWGIQQYKAFEALYDILKKYNGSIIFECLQMLLLVFGIGSFSFLIIALSIMCLQDYLRGRIRMIIRTVVGTVLNLGIGLACGFILYGAFVVTLVNVVISSYAVIVCFSTLITTKNGLMSLIVFGPLAGFMIWMAVRLFDKKSANEKVSEEEKSLSDKESLVGRRLFVGGIICTFIASILILMTLLAGGDSGEEAIRCVWMLMVYVCSFALFIIVGQLVLEVPHEISRIYRISNLCDRFCEIEKRSIVAFSFRVAVLVGLMGTMIYNADQKDLWKSYSAMEVIATAVIIPIILDWIRSYKSTHCAENENGIEQVVVLLYCER